MLKRVITGLCFSLLAASTAYAQVATVVPSFSTFSGITADASLRLYYAGLACNGVAGNGSSGCATKTTAFTSWTWPCSAAAVGSNSAFCISGTNLYVTGQNTDGVLGRGTITQVNSWTTATVGTTGTPSKVVAGLRNSYVLKSNGILYAAGYPSQGMLGITTSANGRSFVQSLTGVVNVFAGENNVYALKTDGSLWAAGDNTNGTLGAGLSSDWSNWVLTMPSGAVKVASSATHALLLKSDGSVWVTGKSTAGQFGQGYLSDLRNNAWIKVADNARDIATGIDSSFIIGKNNQLYVAGDNSFGILGAGPVSTVPAFTPVLSNVANMNTSRYSALAIRGDGTLWGTGQNANGELGLGHTNTVMSWQAVPTPFGAMTPSIPAATASGLAILGTSLSPAKVLLYVSAGGATWYAPN
jgi:alpha-tubulin suppressor-like RCC1 family protein